MTSPTIGVALDIEDAPAAVLDHAVAWGRHLGATLDLVTVSEDTSYDVALGELAEQLPAELRGAIRRLPPAPDDAEQGTPITEALDRLDVDVLLWARTAGAA